MAAHPNSKVRLLVFASRVELKHVSGVAWLWAAAAHSDDDELLAPETMAGLSRRGIWMVGETVGQALDRVVQRCAMYFVVAWLGDVVQVVEDGGW